MGCNSSKIEVKDSKKRPTEDNELKEEINQSELTGIS